MGQLQRTRVGLSSGNDIRSKHNMDATGKKPGGSASKTASLVNNFRGAGLPSS